jgi:hypothetical protein
MTCAATTAVRNSEIGVASRMLPMVRIGFVSRSREVSLPSHVTSTGFSANPRDFSGEGQNGILEHAFLDSAVCSCRES